MEIVAVRHLSKSERQKLAVQYREEVCRPTYAFYTNSALGITAAMYDKEFDLKHVHDYFSRLFDGSHHVWLARDAKGSLLGGVAAIIEDGICYVKAAYVKPDQQQQGLGRQLYWHVMRLAGKLPVALDVVHYSPMREVYRTEGFTEIIGDDGKPEKIEYPWKNPTLRKKAYGVKMIRHP